jgi:hypothetical protein
MARQLCPIATLCALVAIASCDRSKPPDTVVRGQILFRGEPVSGGMIVLSPNSDRGSNGPLLTATLERDGSFTVADPEGKPVPAGWYRIAVSPRAGTQGLPTATRPYPGLPSRFRNPAKSGLEHEVKSGIDNVICLDLDDS